MDVTKRYKFMLSLCPNKNNSREAHTNYFERYNVDWQKAVWTYSPSGLAQDIGMFKTLDGKCEACTQVSYFVPCVEGPVNLEDYM